MKNLPVKQSNFLLYTSSNGELEEKATCKDFLQVQNEMCFSCSEFPAYWFMIRELKRMMEKKGRNGISHPNICPNGIWEQGELWKTCRENNLIFCSILLKQAT